LACLVFKKKWKKVSTSTKYTTSTLLQIPELHADTRKTNWHGWLIKLRYLNY
jgi:hypothetical protein